MKRILLLAITHIVALVVGFAAGVFALPILTAQSAPDAAVLKQQAASAEYSAKLTRDLRGSDSFHWGEGTISVSRNAISHQGNLGPGPDYKVYLTNEFVEDEAEFEKIKAQAAYIGDVKSYDGFLLNVPEGIDVNDYTTVVIWCETFSEFITAGQYR